MKRIKIEAKKTESAFFSQEKNFQFVKKFKRENNWHRPNWIPVETGLNAMIKSLPDSPCLSMCPFPYFNVIHSQSYAAQQTRKIRDNRFNYLSFFNRMLSVRIMGRNI